MQTLVVGALSDALGAAFGEALQRGLQTRVAHLDQRVAGVAVEDAVLDVVKNLGAAAGLGYLIQQAEGVFDVAGVFAGMFVLAAFVIVIDLIVTVVEKRLLVWRPTVGESRP